MGKFPGKQTWDLRFLGEGLLFYRCWPWDDHCEMVDSEGRGWSRRRRALVQWEEEFRDLPYEIRFADTSPVSITDEGQKAH